MRRALGQEAHAPACKNPLNGLSWLLTILVPLLLPAAVFGQTLSNGLESGDPLRITLNGGGVGYSSPAVADIDGDVSNGQEIVVAGADGVLHVHHADGTELWNVKLPIHGCSGASKVDKVYSSPAVGDLFGDGVPYVVIGYGGFFGSCDGGIAAYRGSDGARLWNFNLAAFGRRKRHFVFKPTVFSTPTLSDVDGDGTLEIGFGSFDRHVYLLNADGTIRWYYHAADTVWSSASFFDVDDDGKQEMFIGTDISRNTFLQPATRNGGFLYAFRTDPVAGKLVEFRDPSDQIRVWQRYIKQVVFSSPVFADVVEENPGPEIIIGSGCFFPEGTNNKGGKFIRVLSATNGAILRTLRLPTCTASSPAVGDLTGDGNLEIVVMTPSNVEAGADGKGRLIAWTPQTSTEHWEVRLPPLFPFQSPLLADLDYDGLPEVVQATATYIQVYDGVSGEQLGRLRPGGKIQNTPAIADFDGDGRLDLVVAGGQGGRGRLIIYPNFSSPDADERRQSSSIPTEALIPWGSWRNGASRLGRAD